jgi:hypothetical protein
MGPNALFSFTGALHRDYISFTYKLCTANPPALNEIGTWTAKIAPWWLAAGTSSRLKYRDQESADFATNVYSLNRRAVSTNISITGT